MTRRLDWLGLGAAGVGGVTVAVYFTFTVDDAYIVLRYARNVVDHGQLAFNLGEPVLALTSPLHALVASAAWAVAGPRALVLNKLLMILAVVTSAWLLIRADSKDSRRRVLVLTMLGASPFVWMWAVGGLETALVLCGVTAFALLYDRVDRPRAFLTLNALAGVLFLARYDTTFFVLPVLVASWWRTYRHRGVRAVLVGMGLSAALPLAWLTVTAYHYHDIFPTSFYAKATRDFSWFKLRYLGQFLLLTGVLPLGLLVTWRAARRLGVRGLTAFAQARWPLLAGLTLVFAYGSTHGTVHMMFGYRLVLPYLGVLVLLVVDLLAASDRDASRERWRPVVAVAAGALLLVQIGQGSVVYTRSLGGMGITGEFGAMGLASYRSVFLPVMDATCQDLRSHRSTVPRLATRPPRLLTFAEGYIPFCEPSLYVVGHLVSYRHGVNERWPATPAIRRSVDYLYVMTPRHGTLASQLPDPVDRFDLVSSHTIEYDGGDETFAVYYNPHPNDTRLPTHVR